MGLMDDGDKRVLIGVGVGLAAAGIVKVLMPALSSLGRPVAKGLIKGGIVAYDTGREAIANAAEFIEDMVAEVRAEMEAEREHGHTVQTAPEPGPAQGNAQVH
ncbi:MAG: DUF5132 domain-containing protein [bacterium]|jgi:hypothetical protein